MRIVYTGCSLIKFYFKGITDKEYLFFVVMELIYQIFLAYIFAVLLERCSNSFTTLIFEFARGSIWWVGSFMIFDQKRGACENQYLQNFLSIRK